MHFKGRNVNDIFKLLVGYIHRGDIPTKLTTSRVGDVLAIEAPVTITYYNPMEKVLFNAARDCNPCFHLYESLWMLAGRNDVAPLAYYNSKIAGIASDNGLTFNGAYGYRWRHALDHLQEEHDQLKILIEHLRKTPNSRRAVLSMWNVCDDLLYIERSKDTCCNLSACFSLRRDAIPEAKDEWPESATPCCSYLDMTVFNRSNDLIWGALGTNVVHFAFLLEYLAANLGVKVGVYNQVSNNLHVYLNNWKPKEWLECEAGEAKVRYYPEDILMPLVQDPATFDHEVPIFVEMNSDDRVSPYQRWSEPFLDVVAQKMCHAYHSYKKKDFNMALKWVEEIAADDWRRTMRGWIERREAKYVSSSSNQI